MRGSKHTATVINATIFYYILIYINTSAKVDC